MRDNEVTELGDDIEFKDGKKHLVTYQIRDDALSLLL
jgi:hypothetical protein